MSKKPKLKKRKLRDILKYIDISTAYIQVTQIFLTNTYKEIDDSESFIEYNGPANDIPYRLVEECLLPKELLDGEKPIFLTTTKEITTKTGIKIVKPIIIVDVMFEEDYDLWLENRNA